MTSPDFDRNLARESESIGVDSVHDWCNLTPTSAPWQYARSPILSVCRTPGAFLFFGAAKCV